MSKPSSETTMLRQDSVRKNTPPELQERWSYNGLVLTNFSMPRCRKNCSAEEFWNKFNQRNRSTLQNIAVMMQVLYPSILERQAYDSRCVRWLQTTTAPTIEKFLQYQYKEAQPCSHLDYIGCVNTHNKICSTINVLNSNCVTLMEVELDVATYIKLTHDVDYMKNLHSKYKEFVGNDHLDWAQCTFLTWILWLPWQNVFYILPGQTRSKFKKEQEQEPPKGKGRVRLQIKRSLDQETLSLNSKAGFSYIPLPANWLGWQRNEVKFNGLIKDTKRAFIFVLRQKYESVINAKQFSIFSDQTPLVQSKFSRKEVREKLLDGNFTIRSGCRQYVVGDVFQLRPDCFGEGKVLCIDSSNNTDPVLVQVHVLDKENNDTNIQTVIKISGNTCSDELKYHGRQMNKVMAQRQKHCTRPDDGSEGLLVTYGLHENEGKLREFKANATTSASQETRANFLKHFTSECVQNFPLEFSTTIQAEYSCGVTHQLEGHPGQNIATFCASSLNCSRCYATPQHKDARDNGMTCIAWLNSANKRHMLENHDDIYFLFGNVRAEINGIIYNGVAIKLYDGITFTFDARLLHHGTTLGTCDCLYCGYAIVGNAVTASTKLD